MSKRVREGEAKREPARGPVRAPGRASGWLTLAAVAVLIVLSALGRNEVRGLRKDLGGRLEALASDVARLSAKVDSVAKAASQQPRGVPDPNRTYSVKTEGAPSRGAETAPIVIAEFSDYQ